MPITLTVNGRTAEASAGTTLFDLATALGVRVPTSCETNGKCKECVIEIAEGADLLSAPTPAEKHLKAPFRLSCQTSLVADNGVVRLTGYVWEAGDFEEANYIASNVPGVTRVVNDLELNRNGNDNGPIAR